MRDDVHLVPVRPEDGKFLFQVYAGVRREEVAAWGWSPAQQDAFLRMQFNAQQIGYRSQFPDAAFSIVRQGTASIGSMAVARGREEILLVDIALLPEFRGRGIGTRLLRELIDEAAAARIPLRLSVLKGSRAFGWYGRLGFVQVRDDGVYLELVHQ
jgi:ribosomal protein S18 acetylase RimI-like enzyme